ncbi:MarR family winged helix-turn-helix transcriptional regulator [Aliiroseovarius crassostreae]|uniref:MarR family winged helix-turn-helix transcriptional regulator n=1 Tax=Aliiroseovarius crassostreae TaxID=154981 RepID=UPI003C7B3330
MDRTNATLTALRQILRATELHGREVASAVGLTAVQLRLLKITHDAGGATATTLAYHMRVSQATITALLDKLAAKGMIERRVSDQDRRKKTILITDAGREALENAPDPMQRDFARRFERLEDWEQAMLLAAAERLAALMNADEISAAPILATGDITDDAGAAS